MSPGQPPTTLVQFLPYLNVYFALWIFSSFLLILHRINSMTDCQTLKAPLWFYIYIILEDQFSWNWWTDSIAVIAADSIFMFTNLKLELFVIHSCFLKYLWKYIFLFRFIVFRAKDKAYIKVILRGANIKMWWLGIFPFIFLPFISILNPQ